jgi:hypothetical protein
LLFGGPAGLAAGFPASRSGSGLLSWGCQRSPLHRHQCLASTPVCCVAPKSVPAGPPRKTCRRTLQPSARTCHVPDSFRPCRSSRLRRLAPPDTFQVFCALKPIMGFARFPIRRAPPCLPAVRPLPARPGRPGVAFRFGPSVRPGRRVRSPASGSLAGSIDCSAAVGFPCGRLSVAPPRPRASELPEGCSSSRFSGVGRVGSTWFIPSGATPFGVFPSPVAVQRRAFLPGRASFARGLPGEPGVSSALVAPVTGPSRAAACRCPLAVGPDPVGRCAARPASRMSPCPGRLVVSSTSGLCSTDESVAAAWRCRPAAARYSLGLRSLFRGLLPLCGGRPPVAPVRRSGRRGAEAPARWVGWVRCSPPTGRSRCRPGGPGCGVVLAVPSTTFQ